jgi:hypothetical protein
MNQRRASQRVIGLLAIVCARLQPVNCVQKIIATPSRHPAPPQQRDRLHIRSILEPLKRSYNCLISLIVQWALENPCFSMRRFTRAFRLSLRGENYPFESHLIHINFWRTQS